MASGDELEVVELASESAKKKVKFLCSHGGKILPRPADGNLKYVGGETRVVVVSRDITFSELKKRLSELFNGDMIIKYQLISEDLDMLVSVKSDEDLNHMLQEYDRMHNSSAADTSSSPKLRTFLFPSHHSAAAAAAGDHDPTSPQSSTSTSATFATSSLLEHRYIDAINGGGRTRRPSWGMAPIVTNLPGPRVSSACSSPKSNSPDQPGPAADPGANYNNMIHKVQSSPSLYRPNSPHRPPPPHCHHHLPCRPPQAERLGRPLSFGRSVTRVPFEHYYASGYTSHRQQQHQRGGLGFNNDDQFISSQSLASVYVGLNKGLDRAESLPRTPRKRLWD